MNSSHRSIRLSILCILPFALGAAHPAGALIIDNSTVTIYNSSTAIGAFPVADAIDLGANQLVTDFSGAGTGVGTFLDFDFGQAYAFSNLLFTDRTTSGGGNDAFHGGTTDYTTSFLLTFSNDPTFATNVGTQTVNKSTPVAPSSPADFQTNVAITGAPSARYVQYKVLAANGANVGAADFTFSGTTSTPEPSSVVLLGCGIPVLVLGLVRSKR